MIPSTRVAVADLPPEWVALRREIIVRDGYAVRAGAPAWSIEIKSLHTNEWCVLTLNETGARAFASEAERDAVLRELVGEETRA